MNEPRYCTIHSECLLRKTGSCSKCYYKEWSLKNKDKRAEATRRMKERDRPRVNNRRLINKYKRVFDISEEESEKLLAKRGTACDICNSDNFGRALHLDHCHETNEIRGFLCQKCNNSLGLLNDSIEILESAIAYLMHYKKEK